jgi:hypothetical protein
MTIPTEGPLNISRRWLIHPRKETTILHGKECSKSMSLRRRGVVQQGRSYCDARSVLSVREHGTMARTPLADFFNIPTEADGG